MSDYMLTTVDNPFNPFTEFDQWINFDYFNVNNTCGLLDQMTITSSDLFDEQQSMDIEVGMNEIISNDPLGLYIKVTKDFVFDNEKAQAYLDSVKPKQTKDETGS